MSATRDFLGTSIASGLELEMLTADDVILFVSMDVLAHHLPAELKARLIAAALKASDMTTSLVLDTLGVADIVEHAPAPLLWQIIELGATRALKADSKISKAAVKLAVPSKIVPKAPSSKAPMGPPGPPGSRKPNISARVSQARAGSTTRPIANSSANSDDEMVFDIDTRVGADVPPSDFDVIDDIPVVLSDEITAHSKD